MDDYWRDFVRESEEHITELNNSLLALERSPTDEKALEAIFRSAHTLKGNCGAMGLTRASDLAHAIEDLLDVVRSGTVDVSPSLMDTIFDGVDELEAMIDDVARYQEIRRDPSDEIESLRAPLEGAQQSISRPSGEEVDAILTRFDPPADPDHDTFFVRLSITSTESDATGKNNGVLVVDALIDAFDLIGTEPSREVIENETYGGSFDAVFASAVGEQAIAAALEAVDAVGSFEIVTVTDRFGFQSRTDAGVPDSGAANGADSDGETDVDAEADTDISATQAQDLSVDELLDEFAEFDDLDAMVEEVDDVSAFDEMGDAGSFHDLLDEDIDAAVDSSADSGPSEADSETAASTSANSSATDEPASAAEPDDEVDDADAVFAELKDEVEMVGFDELQDELDELEFEEFDDDEEVGMDELLGEEIDVEDNSFLDVTDEELEQEVDDILGETEVSSADDDGDGDGDGEGESADSITAGVESEADSGSEVKHTDETPAATESADETGVGTDIDTTTDTDTETDIDDIAADDEAFESFAFDDDDDPLEAAPADGQEDKQDDEFVADVAALSNVDFGESEADEVTDETPTDVETEADSELDTGGVSTDDDRLESSGETDELESASVVESESGSEPEPEIESEAESDTTPGSDGFDDDSIAPSESSLEKTVEADGEADVEIETEAEGDTETESNTQIGFDESVDDGFTDETFDDEAFEDDGFGTDEFEDDDLGFETDEFEDDDLGFETDEFEDGGFDDSAGVDDYDSDGTFETPAAEFDPVTGDDTDGTSGVGAEDTVTGAFDTADDSSSDDDQDTIEIVGTGDGTGIGGDGMEIPDISIPEVSDQRDTDRQSDTVQSVRVDVDQIDSLLNLVEGLVTSRVRLRHAIESGEDIGTVDEELDALEDLTTELQETVMDVRLVPLQTVANRLPRVVRDIARDQEKEVVFEQSGEDVELDRSILDRIGDPLIHLVRNAVDHGIEPPAEREAAGKSREGTVSLRATRSRDRVTIEIEDDGSGLDPDRLRSAAVDAEIHTESELEAMDDDEVLDLVFHPGLSTAEAVTDVSGRGVGMDIVKQTVNELDGSVSVDSTLGEGTTVMLGLPVTVAIADVLFVEAGGEEFGIPVKAVQDIENADSVETVDGSPVLTPADSDQDIPVIDLAETLETPRSGVGSNGDQMVVRIRDEIRSVGIQCTEVSGQQEVVIKPFEGFMGDIPGLSGATVRGRGEVVNILDVNTL